MTERTGSDGQTDQSARSWSWKWGALAVVAAVAGLSVMGLLVGPETKSQAVNYEELRRGTPPQETVTFKSMWKEELGQTVRMRLVRVLDPATAVEPVDAGQRAVVFSWELSGWPFEDRIRDKSFRLEFEDRGEVKSLRATHVEVTEDRYGLAVTATFMIPSQAAATGLEFDLDHNSGTWRVRYTFED